MKDYEVNYVHQESKTIPDTNYTFETAMMPARLPKHEAPPTHKDVLLKTWAHDTEAMQCAFVHKDMSGGYWYMTKNKHGMFCWMWTLDHSEAMEKQAEFLNSAAEAEA